MAVVFKNNAKTTLASGITSSATSITVADGSVFPTLTGSDTFFCTLDDGTNIEIVEVTAISSNTLTVTRAQDNTSATSFSTGTVAELRLTAGILNLFSQTGSDINAEVEAYLDANGTTFPDDVKAQFGNNNDLQIFTLSTNGNAIIRETGGGKLSIQTNGSQIGFYDTANNQSLAEFATGGGINLRHNGDSKFTTTSTGVDVTGNATFDDNGKAIFGASSDLSIYHDGSNSYIDESGTGGLIIKSGGTMQFNSPADEKMIRALANGGVELYYNNDLKLETTSTGIDVTGSVTADNAIFGTTSDSQTIVYITSSTTGESEVRLGDTDTDAGSISYTNSNDTLTFRAAAANRMSLDSSGLDVTGTISSGNIIIEDATPKIFLTDTGNNPDYQIINNNGVFTIYDGTNATSRLTINSGGDLTISSSSYLNGNVYIGTSSGANVIFKRTSANYIWADQTGGYFALGTNGRTTSVANANLVLNTDQTSDFKSDVDIAGNINATGFSTNGTTTTISNTVGSLPLSVSTAYDYVAKFESTDSAAALVIQDNNSTNNGNRVEVVGDTMSLLTAGTARLALNSSATAVTGNLSITSGDLDFTTGNYKIDGAGIQTTSTGTIMEGVISDHAVEGNGHHDITRYNILAGADHRYTVTVTKAGSSSSIGSSVFRGDSNNGGSITMANATDEFVITIDMGSTNITYTAYVGVIFGNAGFRARGVKIETYRNGAWQTECDLSSQPNNVVARQVNGNNNNGVSQVRYTFKDPNNTAGMYFRINDLFLINYATSRASYGYDIAKYDDQTMYGTLSFPNNKKAQFGTSNALQVYHDGTNGVITNNSGDLIVQDSSGTLRLRGLTGEDGINVIGNSEVQLYFDGDKKLATKSDGVDITGSVQTSTGVIMNTGGDKYWIRWSSSSTTGLYYQQTGGEELQYLYGGAKKFGVTLSGNATFAGTIDSGAITSTGAIEATSFSDGTISGVTFIDEDSFATNSATRIPTQQSVKSYVDAQVAGVVDSAPGTLNTLNELAAALGDDANFSTTVTNSIATKLPLSGGTLTGNLTISTSTGAQLALSDSGSHTWYLTTDDQDNFFRVKDGTSTTYLKVGTADSEFATHLNITSGHNLTVGGNIDVNGKFIVQGSGTLLELNNTSWNAGNQTHDILYNGWTSATGDYIYLSAAGNSNSGCGTLLVTDAAGFYYGDHSSQGGVTSSATDPLSDVKFRVDGDGNITEAGTISASGSASSTSPTLSLTTSDSLTFNHLSNSFAGNMTSGESAIHIIGRAGSSKNSGYYGYYYAGAGSNDNFVSIGHWAADHLLRVYGNGRVAIQNNNLELPTSGASIMVNAYNPNVQEGGGIFFRDGFDTSNKYNLSIMARSRSNDGSPDGLSINGYEGVFFSTGSNSYQERFGIDVSGNIIVNGQTTIDQSRNLSNIGTITSTGLVKIDANTTVNPLHIHDDSTSGQPGMYVTTTGSYATSTQSLYAKQYNSGVSATLFGQSVGGKGFIGTEGSASSGLLIGTITADSVWIGTNNTAALTINSSQAATFTGDMIAKNTKFLGGNSYNENIRCHPNSSNDYSSLVLGAVSGDSGTGTGQWTLVRYPAATHSNKFTIRHNSTDFVTITTSGNTTFAGTIDSGAITSTGAIKAYGNSDTVAALEIYSNSNHGMRILHRGTDGDFSFERRVNGTNTEFLRIGRGTGNATFAGTISSGAITSSGQVSGTTLKVENGNYDGFFGNASFSWGGSTSYPTIYGSHSDRWVMFTYPHIAYLQNGTQGHTGSTTGATIRFASDAAASTNWDLGIGSTTDLFRIARAGTNAIEINSSGDFTFRNSSHQYVRLESTGSFEQMIRFKNGLANYWYTGIRTSAGIASTADYHIYSTALGNDAAAVDTSGNIIAYNGFKVNATQVVDSSTNIYSTGIINTNHIKDNGSSSGLRLGNFSTSNADETGSSVVTFLRTGGFDDYIIKGSTSRGVFGRQFIGPHFSSNHSWGVFSSGWDTHFQISGDDRIYMKPNVAIGATPSTTGPVLDVYQTADRPSMTIRSSNPGNWAASLIVGATTANQTLVDTNDRPMVIIDGKYPVLNLNHTVTSNSNHGPTIQFTHNGYNSNRQWVIGTDGAGDRLDFGVSGGAAGSNTDKNPHRGIAGYEGVTIMRLFDDGVLIGDTGVYPNEITGPDGKLDVRGQFSHTGGNFLKKTYNKAIGLYANGTASSGSAIGFQQITAEGWAGIYVDYNPYEGWGLYHDNPSNYFYITAELTTGNLGTSFTVPNRDSGTSTAYAKHRFDQNNGNFDAGGAITAQGNITAYSSDRRLKENFKPIESPLDKVKQLNGLYFDWNKVSEDAGFIPDHKQNDVGLIAQDVEKILPQAVAPAPFDTDVITTPKDPKDKNAGVTQEKISISGEDYLTVKYEKLVPLLVEAIKEQQEQIESLKSEINNLKGGK